MGKFELAEQDLEKVAQLNFNENKLWQFRARLMLAHGMPSEALAHIDSYVQVNTKDEKRFLTLRGKVCNVLSRYEEAEAFK